MAAKVVQVGAQQLTTIKKLVEFPQVQVVDKTVVVPMVAGVRKPSRVQWRVRQGRWSISYRGPDGLSEGAGSYRGSTSSVLLRPGPQAVSTHVDVMQLTTFENFVENVVEVPQA